MRAKVKNDRPSHYYNECNFTKGKVYNITTSNGNKGVWTNNGGVHISLEQFDILPNKNIIGGEIL